MRQSSIAYSKIAHIIVCLLISGVACASSKDSVEETYCYPLPNSISVSLKTGIGIRYAEALRRSDLEFASFIVTGGASGVHSGTATLSLDGRTIIFTPAKPFSAGEKVAVTVSPLSCISGKFTTSFSFGFQAITSSIDQRDLLMQRKGNAESQRESIATAPWIDPSINGSDTLPSDFPAIYVTQSNNPSPGNIYLDNFTYTNNYYGAYLIIIDNAGHVLFERSTGHDYEEGFHPQPNGLYTYFDHDVSRYKFYGMNSRFVVVDSFEAANGYLTDGHELIFLPGGGYALLGILQEQVNLADYIFFGDSNATVLEGIIQEFDAARNLVFEWRSRDHFSFSDPTNENFYVPYLDFTHCNSLENDGDTAFILSSRNLDEVTKISREDGNMIWRWGGKNNEFRFVDDSLVFSHQHAVRRLANGNITMFDNGMFHKPRVSRAVEYHLDEEAKTATKVWEYHHHPDVYGDAMGYVQQLDNGNRLIGWGGCDSVAVTEITPDNTTALEVKFDPQIYSYRAYKLIPDTTTSSVHLSSSGPVVSLEQNYPNPFSGSTKISFQVAERIPIELAVYDALGRKIRTLYNGILDPGSYSSQFTSENIPSGEYFCKLNTPSLSQTRMMLITK